MGFSELHTPLQLPILPILKANRPYGLVQDIRAINNEVMPIHPVMPNPYSILSHILPSSIHFTVLDLKNTFLTTPLHSDCQDLFAFMCTDLDIHRSQQLTCTVFPQGLMDSPDFSRQALSSDLITLNFKPSTHLQYVDDFLCSPCVLAITFTAILNFLSNCRYSLSY